MILFSKFASGLFLPKALRLHFHNVSWTGDMDAVGSVYPSWDLLFLRQRYCASNCIKTWLNLQSFPVGSLTWFCAFVVCLFVCHCVQYLLFWNLCIECPNLRSQSFQATSTPPSLLFSPFPSSLPQIFVEHITCARLHANMWWRTIQKESLPSRSHCLMRKIQIKQNNVNQWRVTDYN